MTPWNHVSDSEISRLMEIHKFVNNNNKNYKKDSKIQFYIVFNFQEWPLRLLN